MRHGGLAAIIVVATCALAGCTTDVRELYPGYGKDRSSVPALDPAKSRIWICFDREVGCLISIPSAGEFKPADGKSTDARYGCIYFDTEPGAIAVHARWPRVEVNAPGGGPFPDSEDDMTLELQPGTVHFVYTWVVPSKRGGDVDLFESSEEGGRSSMRSGLYVGHYNPAP